MSTTQKAIVVQDKGIAALVNDRPIPKLRDDYILVKTVAVALNPSDWKHVDNHDRGGFPLVGCDYAGIVQEVGQKVSKKLVKGDRICGITHGCNAVQAEDGTFAEFIVVKGDLQIKIPDNMNFEAAATLGVGITTVGQGLYQTLGLAFPTAPTKEPIPILIYGGSTATGTLGIQFAKLSGYHVLTTCSPHNADMVKSLGADAVFNYHDPDCASQIRQHTGDKLTLAWDTISLPPSAKICSDSLSAGSGVKYASLNPVELPRKDIENTFTVAYTSQGESFEFGDFQIPAKPEDFEFATMFWDLTQLLLGTGKIKPHPFQVQQGLEHIIDGLDALKNNKVSGQKLVYSV
ncbi:Protein TOXD [Hirsutella minnesotensis 3608]|uniref:Protein TOXD n=1 Tax=Hirsutella minnesotensis 3608 TaxID=1043627 RepID=A0A0F8A4R1_9HYPO|nr:Protein TOXD [Hirsutella minnesotensis 3608]